MNGKKCVPLELGSTIILTTIWYRHDLDALNEIRGQNESNKGYIKEKKVYDVYMIPTSSQHPRQQHSRRSKQPRGSTSSSSLSASFSFSFIPARENRRLHLSVGLAGSLNFRLMRRLKNRVRRDRVSRALPTLASAVVAGNAVVCTDWPAREVGRRLGDIPCC